MRDHFAIELIGHKVREAEKQPKVAKTQLALLIQRERIPGAYIDAADQ